MRSPECGMHFKYALSSAYLRVGFSLLDRCWVFWRVAVPAVDVLRATEIRVRAVDSSNNMMPEKCAPSRSPFFTLSSSFQDILVSNEGVALGIIEPELFLPADSVP